MLFLFVASRYLSSSDFSRKVQILVNNEHTLLYSLYIIMELIPFQNEENLFPRFPFQINSLRSVPSKYYLFLLNKKKKTNKYPQLFINERKEKKRIIRLNDFHSHKGDRRCAATIKNHHWNIRNARIVWSAMKREQEFSVRQTWQTTAIRTVMGGGGIVGGGETKLFDLNNRFSSPSNRIAKNFGWNEFFIFIFIPSLSPSLPLSPLSLSPQIRFVRHHCLPFPGGAKLYLTANVKTR